MHIYAHACVCQRCHRAVSPTMAHKYTYIPRPPSKESSSSKSQHRTVFVCRASKHAEAATVAANPRLQLLKLQNILSAACNCATCGCMHSTTTPTSSSRSKVFREGAQLQWMTCTHRTWCEAASARRPDVQLQGHFTQALGCTTEQVCSGVICSLHVYSFCAA